MNKNYTFNLTYPFSKNITVDQLMRQLLIPRKWRHYLRIEKNILINGKYLPLNFKIKQDDQIKIILDHVESLQHPYKPSGHLPDIVYEDDNVLIINKPSGQKTHPNLFETDTALNDAAYYLGYSPYIVHRLDMLTSGLLLITKNPAVVPILNSQLTTKTFHRDYYAKVSTNSKIPDQGIIDLAIAHDPDDQRKRMVSPSGLTAITHYQVIEKNTDYKLLKVTLETGRTHQIRVHLAAIGAPIIGDPLYNPNFQEGQNLQLTAFHMSFIEPFGFERKNIYLNTKKSGLN
nr:RluA family pseudouridine synthase [Lactobacillus hominis]